MKHSKCYLFAVTLLVLAIAPTLASAQGYVVANLYSTGTDDTRAVLNPGVSDLHYTLVSAPASFWGSFQGGLAYTTALGASGWWSPGNDLFGWINPFNNGATGGPASAPAGQYVYRTTFYLDPDCVDPATMQLFGRFAADDNACIWVNGTNTNQCTKSGWISPTNFKIKGPYFHTGVNTVDFVVNNSGGPTGLLANIY